MGAGQSSGRDAAGEDVETSTSYYELLGIEGQATDDEIKKAYRKKALELHPDRNYGNEGAATKTFAEVQAAYEVLSDPQERAWYDSHESAILRGDDRSGQDEAPTYSNVRITTADDLARMVRKFNSNVEFSDAPSGFFGFIRETFDQLAKEEEIAAKWEKVDVPDYPSFGHKDDSDDDVVKRFYSAWSSFSTVKSFAWKDKYKLSDAPDRWFRRRMEKENKASRQEGIKEFNDAVRSLVAFVRKRDPRYVPSTQSEADRQKVLRDATAAQAARARAANQAKMEEAVPEWAKTREADELEESDEEEEEREEFECVACNKVFKSEKQWEAHEKSKKHAKAVHALQKKMRKQNAHLDLDGGEDVSSSGVATPDVEDAEEELEVEDDVSAENPGREMQENGRGAKEDNVDDEESLDDDLEQDSAKGDLSDKAASLLESNDASDSPDSDYASPETIRSRLQSTTLNTPATTMSEAGDSHDVDPGSKDQEIDEQPAKPKVGKAARKRAKKAAAAAVSEQSANNHTCATCNAGFPSKTRLFQHIKDHNHAALKTVTSEGPVGKGKKGKKGKGKK